MKQRLTSTRWGKMETVDVKIRAYADRNQGQVDRIEAGDVQV